MRGNGRTAVPLEKLGRIYSPFRGTGVGEKFKKNKETKKDLPNKTSWQLGCLLFSEQIASLCTYIQLYSF